MTEAKINVLVRNVPCCHVSIEFAEVHLQRDRCPWKLLIEPRDLRPSQFEPDQAMGTGSYEKEGIAGRYVLPLKRVSLWRPPPLVLDKNASIPLQSLGAHLTLFEHVALLCPSLRTVSMAEGITFPHHPSQPGEAPVRSCVTIEPSAPRTSTRPGCILHKI